MDPLRTHAPTTSKWPDPPILARIPLGSPADPLRLPSRSPGVPHAFSVQSILFLHTIHRACIEGTLTPSGGHPASSPGSGFSSEKARQSASTSRSRLISSQHAFKREAYSCRVSCEGCVTPRAVGRQSVLFALPLYNPWGDTALTLLPPGLGTRRRRFTASK